MHIEHLLAGLIWTVMLATAVASDGYPVTSNSVTLVAGNDGTVHASGDAKPNRGDDNAIPRKSFSQIAGLKNIVSVAVDREASDGAAALDSNGDVWMWGRDWCNVVRRKESETQHVPAKHPGLGEIRSIALGTSHLVALHHDGRVLTAAATYDANTIGVLGTGNLETPDPLDATHGVTEIAGIQNAIAIAAGEEVTLILRDDGTVWGVGSKFMLGEALSMTDFTLMDSDEAVRAIAVTTPKAIKGLQDIVAISVGLRFAIALDDSGDMWGWGLNESGQLGHAVSDLQTTPPRKLNGFNQITSLSAGSDFVLASDSSGQVFAQGGNSYGTLSDGGEELEGGFRQIAGVTNAKRVVAGYYNGFAILNDQSLIGWGCNDPTVGGFDARQPSINVTPTPVDIHYKPARPSNLIEVE